MHRNTTSVSRWGRLVLVLAACLQTPSVLAEPCPPAWTPGFGVPGITGYVRALAVFDDGTGPALYVGGRFTVAGDKVANSIAKWDPRAPGQWSVVGGGTGGTDPGVYALTVFDDGTGPALYAGGRFTTAGGVTVNGIAKWNGTQWSTLGSGMGGTYRWVYALTVFDSGAGPVLVAGGRFTTAGSATVNGIAKWNGTQWLALGSGMGGTSYPQVSALSVFNDGSGPALYAGGNFTTAGSVTANRIARWNGTQWTALNTGMDGSVAALTVFDAGSGPALYAGGSFTTAGAVIVNRIAKWNGSQWSALGSGMNNAVSALAVFNNGSGPELVVGGTFTAAGGLPTNYVARWKPGAPQEWSALGTGMADGYPSTSVSALTVFDDGTGTALFVAGAFTTAGGVTVNGITKWHDAQWSALGHGRGMNSDGHALTVFDDGSGSALYAGGFFTAAGDAAANLAAKWDGVNWSALGGGMAGGNATSVFTLAAFDDGNGPALYAGGGFATAEGVTVNGIAKWTPGTPGHWSGVGGGMGGTAPWVWALTVFDDGSGPALYAGGEFTSAGGVAANCIAKWDGMQWSTLGSGMAGGVDPDFTVVGAFTVFDDGTGSALYAGGYFTTAGGVPANYVAKWDGAHWSALGSGMGGTDPYVYALTTFDDGTGPALYAGGQFTTAGGQSANCIAKWTPGAPGQWTTLASGMTGGSVITFVSSLAVFDDGTGSALFAGGRFTTAGGVPANAIAKWHPGAPGQWSALGEGMGGLYPYVYALTIFDDGFGPALYAAGSFSTAGGLGSVNIARWGCQTSPADQDGDGVSNEADNCPKDYNPTQADCDSNGVGDACQPGAIDCNGNGIPDACDIFGGTSLDADGNGTPDECDAQPLHLQSAAPAPQGTLWRTAKNIVRLTFDGNLPAAPAAGQIVIQELLAGGGFGPDLAAGFTFTIDTDPKVLKIRETATSLTHRKWYVIRNTGGWTGVANFEVQYVVLMGDVDNNGFVQNLDAGAIYPNVSPLPKPDDYRYDVDGNGFCQNLDAGGVFPRVSPLPKPTKPSGH